MTNLTWIIEAQIKGQWMHVDEVIAATSKAAINRAQTEPTYRKNLLRIAGIKFQTVFEGQGK